MKSRNNRVPADSICVLRFTPSETGLELEVQDTGLQLNAEEQKRLTEFVLAKHERFHDESTWCFDEHGLEIRGLAKQTLYVTVEHKGHSRRPVIGFYRSNTKTPVVAQVASKWGTSFLDSVKEFLSEPFLGNGGRVREDKLAVEWIRIRLERDIQLGRIGHVLLSGYAHYLEQATDRPVELHVACCRRARECVLSQMPETDNRELRNTLVQPEMNQFAANPGTASDTSMPIPAERISDSVGRSAGEHTTSLATHQDPQVALCNVNSPVWQTRWLSVCASCLLVAWSCLLYFSLDQISFSLGQVTLATSEAAAHAREAGNSRRILEESYETLQHRLNELDAQIAKIRPGPDDAANTDNGKVDTGEQNISSEQRTGPLADEKPGGDAPGGRKKEETALEARQGETAHVRK